MPDMALLILGAVLGGLVNGLSGFGYAVMALGIWLLVLPPVQAGPLVVVSIIGSNLQALPRVWPHINLRHTAPFVAGGLVGVPIGVLLLGLVSVLAFKVIVAVAILAFLAVFMVFGHRVSLPRTAERFNWIVGWVGGIASGLAGLAGVAPTIWATLLGWDKPTSRGIFQSYNLSMAVLSFLGLLWAGFITVELLKLAAIALPFSLVSARFGVWVFERLDEAQFKRIVLSILGLSGVSIIISLFL